MSAGAFGPEKPVDDDVKAITDSAEVVAAVAGLLGTAVASLTTTSYSSQVVAGLNYNINAVTDAGKNVVIRVFKPLPHTGLPVEVKSAAFA